MAGPLSGTPAPRRLPSTALPAHYQRLIFEWEYREKIFRARGEGVARIAPPDSIRLDFFLQNGTAGGFVVVLGDSVFAPAGDDAARYIPSGTLLWATLGRLTAAGPDTTVAVDGDTLRTDIGRGPTWRAAFVGERLVRVERIDDERVGEYVVRPDSLRVLYRQVRLGRSLRLTITRLLEDSAFDEAIWRR